MRGARAVVMLAVATLIAVGAVLFVERGSIPACAGEPMPSPSCTLATAVYPRVCGGAFPLQPCVPHVQGLSPRVRGSQREAVPGAYDRGSIPACAGEPDSTARG